jgi:hypothetical protein
MPADGKRADCSDNCGGVNVDLADLALSCIRAQVVGYFEFGCGA